MTDAIQEQAAMELAWRTEAKAADLKPEDRALIERKLVLAIIAASHQQPMTSPTAVSDVLSTPQVRAAIDALATRLSGPTGEVGGVVDELEGVIADLESSGWARAPGCIKTLKRVASILGGGE